MSTMALGTWSTTPRTPLGDGWNRPEEVFRPTTGSHNLFKVTEFPVNKVHFIRTQVKMLERHYNGLDNIHETCRPTMFLSLMLLRGDVPTPAALPVRRLDFAHASKRFPSSRRQIHWTTRRNDAFEFSEMTGDESTDHCFGALRKCPEVVA